MKCYFVQEKSLHMVQLKCYTSMKELLTLKKKNPAQSNCFVHSSVKTSYEKELVPSKGSLAGGKQAQDGEDINSSPGPEAGALGLVLESRVQPVLVWCESARGGQDVLRQRRRNHPSLRLKVSLFLQHTRSRLPRSLHSK